MKLFIYVLVVAIVPRSWSYPVGDQVTILRGNVSPSSVDLNQADDKSQLFASTPLPSEKPASEALPSKKEEDSSTKKELLKENKKELLKEELSSSHASVKAAIKEDVTQEPFKPSTLIFDDQSNKVSVGFDDSVKAVSDSSVPSEIQADKVPEKLDMKDEPLFKSANQQSNANNQMNSVFVDEPKPVQNELKSDTPKEETKTEIAVVEKKDKVKTVKIEVKQEEKLEESGKKYDSSEEKSESGEQVVLKGGEQKKESSEKSIDKGKPSEEAGDEEENPLKKVKKVEEKKEKDPSTYSSTKLPIEPQNIEAPKSTLPAAVHTVIEKSEQERDVIKREAETEQKLEEKNRSDMSKKDTDLLKVNSSQMKEKSPKGQDKLINY